MSTSFQPQESSSAFNRFDPSVPAEHVRAQMAAARELCPVGHDPIFGYGLVGRYRESWDVLTDHRTFSSADGVFEPRPPSLPFLTALEFDGEQHKLGRAAMAEPFGRGAVSTYRPLIREVVTHYLDAFADRGQAELFAEFAEPIPSVVLGRIVGLDMEQSMVNRRLAMRAINAIGPDPAFPLLWNEFRDFVMSVLADRRAAPRDDYLTQLAQGRVTKGSDVIDLNEDEAFTLLATVLMGGHHSTAAGLVGLLHHLLTMEDVRRAFTDEESGRTVIEESLRLSTPLNFFARSALRDTEVGGCPVPAGQRILVDLVSANRDPRQFSDPESFMTDRGRTSHLAFGTGIHVCPGQHLARAELHIAATELLRRFPNIRIEGEVRHSGLHAGSMLFVEALPVVFTPNATHSEHVSDQ